MIEVRELRKGYGDFEAVRGVSFDVAPGRVVGLLGPNGAGKTTILKVLTAFFGPDSGSVRVAGFDTAEDPLEVKKRVGYLPENVPLYPELTAAECLEFVARARGIGKDERGKAVRTSAETCGVGDMLSVQVEHLSKGYRQRVGLAQAILGDPPVLILDEPTTGLDPNQIREMRTLIRRLGRDRTVLLSTHILQEAEALCSEVLILNEGRIAARGTPDQISESLEGGETLEILLKAESSEAVESAAASLPSGRFAGPPTAEASDRFRVRIAVLGGESDTAAEAVFDWARERGFKILELRKERLSMEDVFARLTREDES